MFGNRRSERREVYLPLNKQAPKRILIVDDDYDSIRLLQRALMEYGCYIQIAVDGYQAVEFLLESSFDLVFLDWKMPGADGGETIETAEKAIASSDKADSYWYGRRQPIITYSGTGGSDIEIPNTIHFSFVDHWTKAMKFEDLHFEVREALNYISNPAH